LDSECPKTASNYFDRCQAYERFLKWNETLPEGQKVQLEKTTKQKRSVSVEKREKIIVDGKNQSTITTDDLADYYDNDDDNTVTTESPGKP
jgi:hypothetical protein